MQNIHDLRKIDLNLLVVLDALLRERSVSRAAERLAMTQPAVSHALARLRDLVADPLLLRVGNEMRLTARARAMLGPLAEALDRVRDVVLPAPFAPARCTRTFRLAMSDYGCALVLPALLRDLRTLAPSVDLFVVKGARLETMRQVAESEVDGATGVFPMLPEGLAHDVLFEERFVVITDRRNLAQDGHLDLEQYLRAPHVHVSTEGLHHSHVDLALGAQGLQRRLALVVPYWMTALDLLPGTDLLLTVSARVLQAAALPETLAVLQPPLAVPTFEFVYIWRADAVSDPEAMWLRERVCAAIAVQ
jgi:DNA-binding transcriptional LysR family regulator